MKVIIPQPLLSYTNRRDQVHASGATLSELVDDLDRQFPGIRFRMLNEQEEMRPNVLFFVRNTRTRDLHESLQGCEEVVILQALAGG